MLPFYKEEENKDIKVEKQQEKEMEVMALGVLAKYFKMDFDESWALIRKQVSA